MWTWMVALALAAPPSSRLVGPRGELTWTVTASPEGLDLEGRSPAWTVRHRCAADLTPIRTEKTTEAGTAVLVYDPAGVDVTLPDGAKVRVDQRGLWDGDALDVRLGVWSISHTEGVSFSAIDSASGKVYAFTARYEGETTHAGGSCRAWRVQVGGVLRWVGPTWDYCYAPDGALVWFSGPIGVFERAG